MLKINQIVKMNTLLLNPFLSFDGCAETAFRFYQSILGGKLSIQRAADVLNVEQNKDEKKKMFFGALLLPNGQRITGADYLPSQGYMKPHNHKDNNKMTVFANNLKELEHCFKKLSQEGVVKVPLQEMPCGGFKGEFIDCFGVYWRMNFLEENQYR